MTTPGVPTTGITRHTIVSLGPPGPHTTIQNTESCTQTVNSSGYGYGCVSSPTCSSPMVLSTDTATSLYGVPLLICISPTGSVQPGGPLSSASPSTTMSSSNPGGLMSSATAVSSTSTNPGGLMSSATSTSVNPGGPMSSAASPSTTITSSGITPSGIASASLQHTSLTESLSTVLTSTSGTSTGTSTSSSASSTTSGGGAIGMNEGLVQSPLVGLVMMCWMGVWGWRALRGRL